MLQSTSSHARTAAHRALANSTRARQHLQTSKVSILSSNVTANLGVAGDLSERGSTKPVAPRIKGTARRKEAKHGAVSATPSAQPPALSRQESPLKHIQPSTVNSSEYYYRYDERAHQYYTSKSVATPKAPQRVSRPWIRDAEALDKFYDLRRRRHATIRRVNHMIKSVYGEQYVVYPFGSTCYGAGRATSDLDLIVLDDERPHGWEEDTVPQNLPRKKHMQALRQIMPPIYNVGLVGRALINQGYEHVTWVKDAIVPIVKFKDPITGISCDMNINNRLGYYNTALLRQYCLLRHPLATMLRLIKSWASHIDLNNPNPQTAGDPVSFSSYSLTLMAIAFLQKRGKLPNLQADPDLVMDTYFWAPTQHQQPPCKVVIQFGSGNNWAPGRVSYNDWVSFLRGWFLYWGSEHNYKTSQKIVSVRDGGIVDLHSATMVPQRAISGLADGNEESKLVVLDPFIEKNCTGRISSEVLENFQRRCMDQHRLMSSYGPGHIPSLHRDWPALSPEPSSTSH